MVDYPEIGTIFTSTPPWEFEDVYDPYEYFYTKVKDKLLSLYEYYRDEYGGKGCQAHELWCQYAINACLQNKDDELLYTLAKEFLDDIR
ncbi:MAG: hypothetical protein JXR56_03125 [Candidatus Cloacimonetes bacterium]|nr:hypothetical protein [Candidatus Cloacimonadota bacterium]